MAPDFSFGRWGGGGAGMGVEFGVLSTIEGENEE